MGNLGLILVLLETPSGFAIVCFDGVLLYEPDAMRTLWTNFVRDYRARHIAWLKEYRPFKDKSSAISFDTGVNRKLTNMILRWRRPGQMLAVGRPDYKAIIEKYMKTPCLINEAVMEVMWGLKTIRHSLVPQDKSERTQGEYFPLSQGLLIALERYGFNFEPVMINDKIISAACTLVDCDLIEEKHSKVLRLGGQYIHEVSGIDTQGWSLLKLATALKIIRYPEEKIKEIAVGDPRKMFSAYELSKFVSDSYKYEDKIMRTAALRIYQEMVCAREARSDNMMELADLAKICRDNPGV